MGTNYLPHGPQLHFQRSDANTADGTAKDSALGWLDNLKRHHWQATTAMYYYRFAHFISEATKPAEPFY